VKQPKIAFIGGGNMASSLIGGLIAKGYPAKQIIACDPSQEALDRLRKSYGVKTQADNQQAVQDAAVVVLAIKPQVMRDVLQPLSDNLSSSTPLIISIAAGITLDSLQSWAGTNLPIVRCMPNTPSLIQTGATGMFANDNCNESHRAVTEDILGAVGMALWVESEPLLDAVTAISGSGPAYFFLLIEALTQAGVDLGLDRRTASQLTQQTAIGAAQMAVTAAEDAAELRRKVTSPGGTTEQAIKTFEEGGLRDLVNKAAAAAELRSRELAQELGDS